MRVARSSGVALVRRFSRSSSEMSAPSLLSTPTALSSMLHTWISSVSSPRTSLMRARCSGPSATTARACESARIQPICSADEVS